MPADPERRREITAAIRDLTAAIRLNPDLPDARAYWARELDALAREARQEDAGDRATESRP